MARVRTKISNRGMAEMLKSDDVRGLLLPYAERVLAAAKADPHDDTGAYEDALRIDQDTTDRAVTRIVAGDKKGHILEARYGILARSLDAAG